MHECSPRMHIKKVEHLPGESKSVAAAENPRVLEPIPALTERIEF